MSNEREEADRDIAEGKGYTTEEVKALIRKFETARNTLIDLLKKEKPGYADWWYERAVDREVEDDD